MIVIAIMSDPKKPSSWLTKWATGSPAYHIAFVDLDHWRMYDMNLLFRRRLWPHYPAGTFKLYRCPVEVIRTDLEWELDTGEDWYGVLDYMAFAVKKLFKGWTAPSFKGAICSEKVQQILVSCGWKPPWRGVPSPADFEKVLEPL